MQITQSDCGDSTRKKKEDGDGLPVACAPRVVKYCWHPKSILLQNTDLEFHSQPEQSQIVPLFSLPQEGRDLIYRYVLGGQVLHITSEWPKKGSPISHGLCIADETEDSVCSKSLAEIEGEEDFDYLSHHIDCLEPHRGLDIRLLRVCKRVYEEARLIPYTANAFSIIRSSILEDFLQQLQPDQSQSIRALHLYVHLTRDWTRMFSGYRSIGYAHNVPRALKLHTLHVWIKFDPRDKQNIRSLEGRCPDVWVEGFLQLQQCQLKHVTVMVTCDAISEHEMNWDNFIETRKQMYCERVRKKLLGHRSWDDAATIHSEAWSRLRVEGEAWTKKANYGARVAVGSSDL